MTDSALGTGDRSALGTATFHLAVLVTLAVAVVAFSDSLVVAFTGWGGLGGESVHRLVFAWTLLVGVIAPAALQFIRTERRVVSVLAPLVVLVPLSAFAAVEPSPLLEPLAVLAASSLVALLAHPSLSQVVGRSRADRTSILLLVLVALAAVPLGSLAVGHAGHQLARSGPHAQMLHWGAVSVAAAYVLVIALLAALRCRDWRFPAWSAGLLAVVLGATSVLFDAQSSAGDAWGGAGLAWGVAFVVAAEYVRERRDWPAPFVPAKVVERSRDRTGSD